LQVKSWSKKLVAGGLLATMLTGCSLGGGSAPKEVEGTLKVVYYDEGSFFQDFGMLFSVLNEKVDIQVVTTQNIHRNSGNDPEFDYEKAYEEFLEAEKPDLIMVDISQYEKMASEGKLHDLEAYMAQDKFDTEGMIPGIAEYMKELGGGKIYGFPTSFSSQVLYYNKALFDKYNIEYPTDKMTWDQIIQLAKRFPTDGSDEDRVYGIKMGWSDQFSQVINMLADSEGLNYVDAAEKKMTINTPAWKSIVETALGAANSNALYFENYNNFSGPSSYEDYMLRNPFISNRLAMTVDGNYFMEEINRAKDYFKEEGKTVEDWDIVTMPVSAQSPDESSSTWYSNIFAISAQSTNKDLAWKFISFVGSEEYARVKAKTRFNGGFPVRTKYIKDEAGRNFEAFYKLRPARNNASRYADMDKLPPQFGFSFHTMMEEEFQAIKDDKKTIDEVLSFLQTKGEELLLQDPMTEEELQKMIQEKYSSEAGMSQVIVD